jgi:cell wall-associated NlpC family hydrolase
MEPPGWSSQYVGIPFRELGRDFDGCDCWGLARLVSFHQFGRKLPSYVGEYDSTCDSTGIAETIRREARAFWTQIPAGSEAAGDIPLIRMLGVPMHVGIVVCPGKMLHVERGVDAVIEDYRGLRWKHRILGFYRYGSAG